ncbi:MAG: dephospho-CoA kinase [Sphingomonadaceae bacterium]
MIIVGLTGSIGMGKSTVAAMFAEAGVPVFDADAVVHRLQGPGGRLVAPIEAAFLGTTSANGVDRTKLGAEVFNNAERLRQLEGIVHPAVADERQAFLTTHHTSPMVVLDIPLLFEKGRPPGLDIVLVVSAPADVQRARVLARPGMTESKFERVMALQMPDVEKRARADVVIDTGVSFAETRAQVQAIIACLTASKSG